VNLVLGGGKGLSKERGKVKEKIFTPYLGQLELQTVVKALFELQNCCQTRNTGSFSVKEHPIEESVESEATLNKYSKERTFCCPDGKERLFERHVKLRLCNWRIHFFPEKPGKVIVGYIGRHLPTVKYPT